MTPTTAIIVSSALAAALLGALFVVMRLADRLPVDARHETLHPSQPLELAVVHDEWDEPELARVA